MTDTLVALHGFTQTGSSWRRPLDELALLIPTIDVHTPDLPGHGMRSASPLGLEAAADELAANHPPGIWIGYSMGGRHLLHVATRHPDVCEALVLVSTTAGLDDDDERARRRAADDATAERITAIGVSSFIDEWISQPLFAGRVTDPDEVATRRSANTADGLAASLRLAGTGTQRPLWHQLADISVPTLIITGADDAKFTSLGERLEAALPVAERVTIADAGHAVHLERPTVFAATVADWITRR